MKLIKIRIHNFLSIGDAIIPLDKFKGVSVIQGINKDSNPVSSNGSGKSAVIESIVFALFGRTIRKTRESSIIRNGTKSSLVCLTVDFAGKSVYIERGRRPSKLTLTINGEDCSRESAIETQKYLEEYLNIDFITFTTAMMFGQRNASNFITANPAEKRKILQTFLGINEYFTIREVINAKKRITKRKKEDQEVVYRTCNEDLKDIEEKITKEHEKQGLEDIPNAEEMLSTWEEIEGLGITKNRVLNDISLHETNKKKILKKCPACSQDIPENKVAELKKEYAYKISRLKEQLNGIKIPQDPKYPKKYLEDYLSKRRFDTSLDILKELKAKKEEAKKIAERNTLAYNKELKELQYWEVAFSEQGIIKYIIKNIIDFFNGRASHYLSLLTNGHLTLMFDQQLSETLYSGKSQVEYNAMSGGESKKVQIAVMLALHDLLKFNGKSTPDFLFMDEITEIDRQGLRSMSSLMNTLSSKLGKKIVLITHNTELLSELKVTTTVVVEKSKGKTKIKEISHE